MLYALISNGNVSQYPVDPRAAFPTTSFPADMSNVVLPDGCVQVVPTDQPSTTAIQTVSEGQPVQANGVWEQTWVVSTMPMDQQPGAVANAAADQITRAATYRENAAATFSFDGITGVACDDQAQGRLTATITALGLPGVSANTTVGWEMAPGQFKSMSLSDLQSFALAMLNHVQGCWAVYQNICGEVANANSVEAVLSVDITSGYPAS